MPYTPEHKKNSRDKILASAYELISAHGYDAVTVDAVMANCEMTRGAFYGHFSSKSELYREAIRYAFSNSKLVSLHNSELPEKQRLISILDGYLSIEHVKGVRPCPLAFLATDISIREPDTKKVFSDAYMHVNQLIYEYAHSRVNLSQQDILSLTAMVIGTVALARTVTDDRQIEQMLAAAQSQAKKMLEL
jgi:TetR/AcrR family transcriptional repressor of nem operon